MYVYKGGNVMRIKEGFVLREVAGQYVVIATGEASKTFHGMIKLNLTGKEIWQGLQEGLDKASIAQRLQDKFQVSLEEVVADVDEFLKQMQEKGFLIHE